MPPRASGRLVQELRNLLVTEGIQAPYVLVGHSFGGLNMMLLAALYPGEVAGMALVDSVHPDQVSRLLAILPQDLAQRFKDGLALGDEPMSIEERMQSEAEVKAAPSLPDVPLVVLIRGQSPKRSPEWPSEEIERVWREMQEELARLTPQGKLARAEKSGHYIQRDQPELVIEAIREIVEYIRAKRETRNEKREMEYAI